MGVLPTISAIGELSWPATAGGVGRCIGAEGDGIMGGSIETEVASGVTGLLFGLVLSTELALLRGGAAKLRMSEKASGSVLTAAAPLPGRRYCAPFWKAERREAGEALLEYMSDVIVGAWSMDVGGWGCRL